MTKYFNDIEELKQCYQNEEDSRFCNFVLEVEQMVEKMISEGLKYNGRIIWDSAYSGFFNSLDNTINFAHYLVDKDESVNSIALIEENATVKYVKLTHQPNYNKRKEDEILQKIKKRIENNNNSIENLKYYLKLYFDNKEQLKKVLNTGEKNERFKIFNNPAFDLLVLNLSKESIDEKISAVIFAYNSYVIYNPNNDMVHLKFYVAKDNPKSFLEHIMLDVKVDENLENISFKQGDYFDISDIIRKKDYDF